MKKHLLTLTFLASTFSLFGQLDNNLVLHVPIDNNTMDIKGAKNISNSGATLSLDRFGRSNNALFFDGNNDALTGDISGLELDTFSYSIWVKFEDYPTTGNLVFLMNVGGSTKDAGLNLANNYAGYTGFSGFSYAVNGTSYNYTTGTLPSKGAWHHLVVSRASDKIQLYLDGTLAGTSAAVGLADYSGSNLSFSVGARVGTSNFFKGFVDDIRIYNRPVTAQEVTELFTIANGVSELSSFPFSIYPNPSAGTFTIALDNETDLEAISVYDMTGKLVTTEIKIEGNHATAQIERKGLFLVSVVSNGNTYTQKVFIR